jgi:membrane-associated phospholipid phosphatase
MPQADNALEQAELNFARRIRGWRDLPVADAIHPVSKLADQPPMLALAAAGLALGLLGGRPRIAEAGARALASVLLATGAKHVIKNNVRRTRPHRLLDEHKYDRGMGGTGQKADQSFPSGHTADAVAAARAVTRAIPQAAIPAAAFAILAAVAQPLRAAHYPSDVAAGGAIGWLAELLVDRAAAAFATHAAPS